MRKVLGNVAALAAGLFVGYSVVSIDSQKVPPDERQQVETSLGLSREPSPAELSFYQILESAVIENFHDGNRARLLPLLRGLTVDQLTKVADHYHGRTSESTAYAILDVTLKLWSDRDPHSFLKDSRNHRFGALPFKALTSLSPKDAVQIFSTFSLKRRKNLWNDFLDHLLDTDPEQALKLASLRDRTSQLKALEKVMETDPDKATSFVESMPEGLDKREAEKILSGEPAPRERADPRSEVSQLLIESPAKAAEAVTKLRGYQQLSMVEMVLPAFLKSDREAALAWIENLTNPAARATARREVALAEATGGITHGHQPPPPPPGQAPQSATASIASTPEALADHLKSYPEALHGKIVSRFVQDQYATNPKEAAALILSFPKGPHQGQALETFMMRGTEDDPATAAELFNHLPPSPKYLRWIEQISRSFVKADPKAAFEWAQELPHEGYRREALKQVTPELTRTLDPTDILTQLQSLPQDHAQEAATSTLLEAWSNLDLKEATTTALDLGHHRVLRGMFTYGRKPTDEVIDAHQAVMEAANVPQEDQLSIATTLAERFAASDAEGSLEWSQSLPQGAIQQTALQTSISQWAQADAAAASRYVSEFDNAELKDHATAGLVAGTVEIDQEASFRWALTISDESLRADAMTKVVRQWRGSDPEALRAALHSTTSLSSQERTKWLEDLP